jgi:serine/threonine-protein kinase SRPK3
MSKAIPPPSTLGTRFLVLGWGHFSTFGWRRMTSASRDLFSRPLLNSSNSRINRPVVLKVVKFVPRYTETALDESNVSSPHLLPHFPPVQPNPTPSPSHSHPGRSRVIFTSDINLKSPNGVHVCVVFEVLGKNLLDLSRIKGSHAAG